MKYFLAFFIVLLLFVTIGMLVGFYYVRKGIRYFRRFSNDSLSDEEFERMANKYYRNQDDDSEQFDKDYFKGKGWQQRQDRQQDAHRRRTTQGPGGITIEDRRSPSQANKKIFTRDEGEYVEFTES